MSQEIILKGRLIDLANKAYRENVYAFSNFLGLSEQNLFHQIKEDLPNIRTTMWGGSESCERLMVRFGSPEEFGYEEVFPISIIKISGKMPKYAEALTHRDCLGALMNLGIERDVLGDIVFSENDIYLFCKDAISEYIIENLNKIKHTDVECIIYGGDELSISPRFNIDNIQVSSPRIDAIISKSFKLSRDNANSLIKSNKVFLNGKEILSNSTKIKENDIISVRGHGRLKYIEHTKTTKKGNMVLKIHRFV